MEPKQIPYHLAESPDGEQRWKHGRTRFVPPADLFDPKRASVVPLDEGDAKALVCAHHYSHSYPAARFRTGLTLKDRLGVERLVGVAVFGLNMQQEASMRKYLGIAPEEGVELSRLVLLPEALFNAETYFLGRSFRLLKATLPEVKGILSYCDPIARHDAEGNETKRGHTGMIYRAHNANYLGRSGARTHTLTTDGRLVSERMVSKLRNGERGAGYAYRTLLALGAPPRRPLEADDDYVERAMKEGPFKKARHPGNLIFTWKWAA